MNKLEELKKIKNKKCIHTIYKDHDEIIHVYNGYIFKLNGKLKTPSKNLNIEEVLNYFPKNSWKIVKGLNGFFYAYKIVYTLQYDPKKNIYYFIKKEAPKNSFFNNKSSFIYAKEDLEKLYPQKKWLYEEISNNFFHIYKK